MVDSFFEYDGIRSTEFGLQIIRLDPGIFSVPMASAKNIIEDENSRVMSPYFYRTKYQPLTFSLTFTTLDGVLTTEQLYEICGWLFTNSYRPFVSSESPSKMLYCIGTNQSDFMTTGINSEGYFTIEFRCRDPYYLTLPQIETFDLSDNTTSTTIQVSNYSNVGQDYYMPEIEFELLDDSTAIEIYNLNDGNRKFKMSNLNLLESVYVNNNKKQIISSTGLYRLNKLENKNWFRLVKGVNNLKVVGKCNLQFKCQFPIFN